MDYDKAYSGLECAIILIAFVVVASVFSYVMLGAGFFSSGTNGNHPVSGVIVDKIITYDDSSGYFQVFHLKVKTENGHVIDKRVDQDTYYEFDIGDHVDIK